MRNYPIKRNITLLRKRSDGLYEERKELWNQLREYSPDLDSSEYKELIFSAKTLRVFKLTRRVTPEAIEDDPKRNAQDDEYSWIDPQDFIVSMFIQVEGDLGQDWTAVSEEWIPEKSRPSLSLREQMLRDMDKQALDELSESD